MVYYEASGLTARMSSEVDLNGSLWYKKVFADAWRVIVLKLTSTGHYGIFIGWEADPMVLF